MAAVIDVALTPRDSAPAQVMLVVDCIRASSTIAQALAAGYQRVVCVAEIEEAHRQAPLWDGGVVLGGERRGTRIDGFDLGNSPAEYRTPAAATLVLTTTNGTRAILQAAREADIVLVASLTCLERVCAAAAAAAGDGDGDVAVRCAGVRGALALDDAYVAGRIVDRLCRALPDRRLTDAALAALALTRAYPDAAAALSVSQSARDLDGTGLERDVALCAATSVLAVAPRVVDADPVRAIVAT
jgi:2-phosphosulfolactate phosphatase